MVKMLQSSNSEQKENKKYSLWACEGDKHGYTGAELKVYSCFSRARDY
jgi:hypothetical protein